MWVRTSARDLLFSTAAATALPEVANDPRIVNELRGFICGLQALSEAHRTAGVVDLGTVQLVAGSVSRMRTLVRLAERLELLEETRDSRHLKAYRLVGGA